MSKSKKIILAVSMLLVLAVAAYLNYALLGNNGEEGEGGLVETSTFFTTYRQNWEEMRTEEINSLNEIIATEGTEYEEARATATAQKQKIIQLMETELLLESLLRAKGYTDIVVTMGIDSNNVNIIASESNLTLQDTAIIYNTVVSELGVSPDYVKILPI